MLFGERAGRVLKKTRGPAGPPPWATAGACSRAGGARAAVNAAARPLLPWGTLRRAISTGAEGRSHNFAHRNLVFVQADADAFAERKLGKQ